MNLEGPTVSAANQSLSTIASVGVWLALVLACGSGCIVRVYQPMSGLHDPIVVDPRAPNFKDVRLTVHCVPGDYLTRSETSALCRKVGTLFENQGAVVRTVDSVGRADDELQDGEKRAIEPTTDLTLELRSRKVHKSNHPLSWALTIASFTALPGVSEYTFAQDVSIRDESGFLLVSDSLKGRVIRRFGFGPWLGNALADIAKEKGERITGGASDRDLSEDMYGQLSQMTFNAKMQWEVLRESAPVRSSEVP